MNGEVGQPWPLNRGPSRNGRKRPKPTVVYSDLPKDEAHGWKFLAIGPDKRLYFNVGAPCNICMPPPTNAQLRSIATDGSDAQIIAHGIRQVVGDGLQSNIQGPLFHGEPA